ncbi:hypothetical protein [Piscirickettsia salmonis]|uniref:hypothetical protein n=1 Tax=Piscirickettsia salmonis TaxID=1238 RepID=UPI003EBDD014
MVNILFWFLVILIGAISGFFGSVVATRWGASWDIRDVISALGVVMTFSAVCVALWNGRQNIKNSENTAKIAIENSKQSAEVAIKNADKSAEISRMSFLHSERIKVFNNVKNLCARLLNSDSYSTQYTKKSAADIMKDRHESLSMMHEAVIYSPILFKSEKTHKFLNELKGTFALVISHVDLIHGYGTSEDENEKRIYKEYNEKTLRFGKCSQYSDDDKHILNLLYEFPDLLELHDR